MATLYLTDEQVVELVKQLPPERQRDLIEILLVHQWPEWTAGADYAAERARATACSRGRNWDSMTEEEREDFIDQLVHEDR